MTKILELKQDKAALIKEVLKAGGKPAKGNMWHCPWHKDATASAWIKKSNIGWYIKCFTCNIWKDIFDIRAQNDQKDISEILNESEDRYPTRSYYYKTTDELIASLDAIAVEEVNPYTDPATGNVDLLTIRYLPRGGQRKAFTQAYHTDKGYIKKRPPGLLPLFNRARLLENDTILYVEGEKVVRSLTSLGFTATTGSGGASNGDSHDYSPLAGKTVFLWPDADDPGKQYMELVRDKLLELNPVPTVYMIDISPLELPVGGDAVDLIEKVKAEGGDAEDCKIQVELLLAESDEAGRLNGYESHLEDMQEGRYTNFPIPDFPILTNEAVALLNKKITVIYGSAGHGKSLFIGKFSDDLALRDYKVVRLQLEDEFELHLDRSFAQQAEKADLANADWHFKNKDFSRELYQDYKRTLDCIAATIVAGEGEEWNADKVLSWIERQLKSGKELIIIDPISVIMTEKVWITSHKLMWGTKKLLSQYPNARVVFVSHPNAEGEVSGGQAFKRFCQTLLLVNRAKAPKNYTILNKRGEQESITTNLSIAIAKSRYGGGSGLELAVKLNSETLTLEEMGVILSEQKETAPRLPAGRNLEKENSMYIEEL